MLDFREWNKVFDYLRHRHDTWYVFKDFLNMVIDNFTIPGETPMFNNDNGRYTDDEINYFGELFQVYLESMQEIIENNPYCDFLGEWWESDQNMTNKFKAQFFTPMNVCELMTDLTVLSDSDDDVKIMTDGCCGSGRFGIVYHDRRPRDWFFLADLDEYAVKMTIVNMLLHGMRGVVAWQNTLTKEVFGVWVVTPDFLSYAGLPYVVPYGTDLEGALTLLPRSRQVEVQKPEVNQVMDTASKQEVQAEDVGGLDKWMK